MVPLSELWLPILVAAVVLQFVSALIHTALGFWHTPDYWSVGEDRAFLDAMRGLKAGLYLVPRMNPKMTPEQKAEWESGPTAVMYVRNPARFSFGKTLGIYFLYCLVSSIFVAYIAGQTLAHGTPYLRVFQIAGATGTIFWAFGNNISDAIWYGKPWRVAFKYVIDGVLYGLLMGGVFGWLWPG
jgi:hypothetical protein